MFFLPVRVPNFCEVNVTDGQWNFYVLEIGGFPYECGLEDPILLTASEFRKLPDAGMSIIRSQSCCDGWYKLNLIWVGFLEADYHRIAPCLKELLGSLARWQVMSPRCWRRVGEWRKCTLDPFGKMQGLVNIEWVFVNTRKKDLSYDWTKPSSTGQHCDSRTKGQ